LTAAQYFFSAEFSDIAKSSFLRGFSTAAGLLAYLETGMMPRGFPRA
jgi:hypothetical protein